MELIDGRFSGTEGRAAARVLRVLALLAAMVCASPLLASQKKPVTVIFETQSGRQMEVWVDGRRLGSTPLRHALMPGNYYLSAGGEGVVPILREFVVFSHGDKQTLGIKDEPLTSKNYFPAVGVLAEARGERPDNVHLEVLALSMVFEEEKFDTLLGRLPESVREGDPMVLYLRARRELEDRKDPTQALHLTNRAIKGDETFAPAYRLKAKLMLEMAGPEEARKAAERAALLDPRNPESYVLRGKASVELEEEAYARLDFEHALRLRPGYAEAEAALEALDGRGAAAADEASSRTLEAGRP
ncbi:MAG: PEGA domain-containing protein [Sumerlaeia bacterium]